MVRSTVRSDVVVAMGVDRIWLRGSVENHGQSALSVIT